MRISDWSSDVCSSDLRPWPRQRTSSPPRGSPRYSSLPANQVAGCWYVSASIRVHPGRPPKRQLRGRPPPSDRRGSGHSPSHHIAKARRNDRWPSPPPDRPFRRTERKSVVKGKSVSVHGDLGGSRIITKTNINK